MLMVCWPLACVHEEWPVPGRMLPIRLSPPPLLYTQCFRFAFVCPHARLVGPASENTNHGVYLHERDLSRARGHHDVPVCVRACVCALEGFAAPACRRRHGGG